MPSDKDNECIACIANNAQVAIDPEHTCGMGQSSTGKVSEAMQHVEEIRQQLDDGAFEAINAQHAIMWLLSAIEDLEPAQQGSDNG